jgi:hypothetical protein
MNFIGRGRRRRRRRRRTLHHRCGTQYDITEILLKVALNTITQTLNKPFCTFPI